MTTKDFEIYYINKEMLGLVSYNTRFSNRINSKMEQYNKSYRFKKGEEPIFLITEQEIDLFVSLLPKSYDGAYISEYMRRTLTQIKSGGDGEE